LSSVHILRDDGSTTRITVSDMQNDAKGYAAALAMLKPAPKPAKPSPVRGALTGLLVSDAVAGPIVMADPVASPAERQAATSFFDEPVTW